MGVWSLVYEEFDPGRQGLRELAQRGYGGLRVAVRSAETPPELLEAADLVVDGPEGVLALLEKAVA
jgi:trehalose 6-phosphate phosphatase